MLTPDFLAQGIETAKDEPRIYGITLGRVVNNFDTTGQSRVQVSLSWLPGVEPWARIASPSAGKDRGMYFIPQIDDEVVIAFNHGDVTDAYILGSLWNALDRPPAPLPSDATTKRLIVTPAGHRIEIDDLLQSVTITTTTKQKVTLAPDAVTLEAGTPVAPGLASLKLDSAGNVTLKGAVSITLQAPSITLDGTRVAVKGTASASLESAGDTAVKGALVRIN